MTVVAVLQWTCVGVFIVTAIITLAALVGLVKLGGTREEHRYYLRKLFHALVLEVVVVAVGAFAHEIGRGGQDGVPIVPRAETVRAAELPSGTNSDFELLRDMSVWDLRGWREVPENKRQERISPAHFLNYLHVKKRQSVATYTAHYATGGLAIDLRSITHSAKIYERAVPQDHKGEREYAVEVDVSGMATGAEFLIVIEATYWNGFQGAAGDDAATYADSDIGSLGELGMIVLFPENKRFSGMERIEIDDKTEAEAPYRSTDTFYPDHSGLFVYWDVKTRKPDTHYQLRWKW
jgi:hypothetical protein